jgi:hypothetical protein
VIYKIKPATMSANNTFVDHKQCHPEMTMASEGIAPLSSLQGLEQARGTHILDFTEFQPCSCCPRLES